MSELEYRTVEVRTEPSGRIIDGLVMPFGETAIGDKGPEQYAPGSIALPAVVPFHDDHAYGADGAATVGPRVGYAELREEADGYYMRAVVDDTADGRSFYTRIADAGRAALSLGFHAIADPIRDGVRYLEQLLPDHIAAVPAGAYSGATVTELRAATIDATAPTSGETMTEETTDTTEPAVVTDDSVAELRSELTELTRIVATQARTNELPPNERPRPEIRTLGEWVYYLDRAMRPEQYSPEEHRLAVERINLSDAELRAVATTPSANASMPVAYMAPIEEIVRAGRPFINAIGSLPLPATGMTFVRSVVTTGTTVAWESSEADEGSSTALDTTQTTVAVKMLKGVNALSLQAALRGSPSTVDALLRDQAAARATELDSSAINGAGTLGTSTGALAGVLANGSINDAAVASWTTANFLAAWNEAIGEVFAALNQPPSFVAAHPRRIADIMGLLDTTNRPLLNIDARPSVNTLGGIQASGGSISGGLNIVGSIQYVPVIADANLPTNLGVGTDQDIMVLFGPGSFEYYEAPARSGQWQSPATFLTQYGHAVEAALVPVRPAGLATISGAGLK